MEAQAAGTPVIAYARGGALETIVDGASGLFFHEQTADALAGAIEEFESRSWSPQKCLESARRFSPDVFTSKFKPLLKEPVLNIDDSSCRTF